MKARVRRLLRGQTCKGCGRRRRVRWFLDTGCCSERCARRAIAEIALTRPLATYPEYRIGDRT